MCMILGEGWVRLLMLSVKFLQVFNYNVTTSILIEDTLDNNKLTDENCSLK